MSYTHNQRQIKPQKLHPRVKQAMAMQAEPVLVRSDRDIEALENIHMDESVSYEVVKFPDPPPVVNAHCNEHRVTIWFDYRNGKDPVLSWEIRRYRLDKDGSWSVKGVKQCKDVASRKVFN